MLARNDNVFHLPDPRGQTLEERDRLVRQVIHHARIAQARAIRALVRALVRALFVTWPKESALAIWRALAGGWAAYRRRRTRRLAVAELRALDDRELKDIGLRRSEIESVIYGPDDDRQKGRKPAVWLEAAE